jgi:hypothetical protein
VQVNEFVGILKRVALSHNLISFLAENIMASKMTLSFAFPLPSDDENIAL